MWRQPRPEKRTRTSMVESTLIRSKIKQRMPSTALFTYRLIRQGRTTDISSSLHFLMSRIATVSMKERLEILRQIYAISASIYCAHTQDEMLSFIRTILTIPKDVKGCIVEAGCFKGGSTAKFSLAAE